MGTLYVVATPIGNLSDISKRALEVLSNVEIIAAEDTRHTLKLLNHYNIKNKLVSYHKFNEETKSNYIVDKYLKEGIDVALVSDAGTPCISDPGYSIVKHAREDGINVIGIPGPSAVVTSLSVSGFDLRSFSFYGFLPRDNSKRMDLYEKISASNIDTFVIYESPRRIKRIAGELEKYFPNSKVCFCQDLTKLHEKAFWGRIEDVSKEILQDDKAELGEYTIVVEMEKVIEDKTGDELSIEALLIDVLIKEKCSVKEAINIVKEKYKYSKRDVYEASLNLKKMIG